MPYSQYTSRRPYNYCVIRNIPHHRCARTNHNIAPDSHIWNHSSSGSNQSPFPDAHRSAKYGAWGYMNTIANDTIVFNDRASIHYYIFAYGCIGIRNYTCKNYCTLPYCDPSRQ